MPRSDGVELAGSAGHLAVVRFAGVHKCRSQHAAPQSATADRCRLLIDPTLPVPPRPFAQSFPGLVSWQPNNNIKAARPRVALLWNLYRGMSRTKQGIVCFSCKTKICDAKAFYFGCFCAQGSKKFIFMTMRWRGRKCVAGGKHRILVFGEPPSFSPWSLTRPESPPGDVPRPPPNSTGLHFKVRGGPRRCPTSWSSPS